MSDSREPYQFNRSMKFAFYDIKRICSVYPKNPDMWKWLPNEIKNIILEIKHGIFDQGK